MKKIILANRLRLTHGPRVRHRTAALLAGLTLVAATDLCLPAQSPPAIAIEKSVLLFWPENSAEEQVVVGADSLATNAVWTPWPEPIFKQQGQLCMAVPTTSAQQFFKLVPGTQFIDDFSDTQGPFASRNPYQLTWAEPGDDIRVTDGVLRIACQGPVAGGVLIQPPEPGVVVRDFHASVDILDWVTSSTNWNVISIIARGVIQGLNSANGFIGILVLNKDGIGGKVTLSIWDGSTERWGPAFDFDPTASYRLEFSGVGTNLLLRVLNLRTKQVVQEMRLTNSTFREGFVGFWVNTLENVPESHEIILDNFFVTGTKP